MVLFGELVLPSSRVLWDDEEEYEQFSSDSQTLQWQGNSSVPSNITNLLIIETTKLIQLTRSCLPEKSEPFCFLPICNVSIYKLNDNNYLVLCEEGKDVISGEITEKLIPWLQNTKKITAITSNCTAMFYKNTSEEMPNCFIRALVTGNDTYFAPKLEAPNLATGIAAGVLSYCQHMGIAASLYICYSDSRPLDSTTARPILELLKKLNISTQKPFIFNPVYKSDSNLYM